MSGHFSKFGYIVSDVSLSPGPRGAKGDAGERGLPGPQGERGMSGEKGERGSAGEQGPKGDKGERGEQGPAGECLNCSAGPQEEAALKGDKGEKGDTGDKGEKGDKGDKGERGNTGGKGDKGEKGDIGFKGEKGDKGDTGDKGDKGEKGEQASPGQPGIFEGISCYTMGDPIAFRASAFQVSLEKALAEFGNCTSLNSEGRIVVLKSGKYLVSYSVNCIPAANVTYSIKVHQRALNGNEVIPFTSVGFSQNSLTDLFIELNEEAKIELMGELSEPTRVKLNNAVITLKKLSDV